MQRRAERRMTGERQFFRDGEDADFLSCLIFSGGIARQDESCLGKIHLTRERLHFVIIQAARVGENGERITRQRCQGEDVKLDEFVSAVRHKASLAFYFRNFLILTSYFSSRPARFKNMSCERDALRSLRSE